MRSSPLTTTVLAASLLAACGAPPPPPAAPAPVVAAPDPAVLRRAARATAQADFDEATRLVRQGRWSEAEARYRRAVAAVPDEATFRFGLANGLLASGRVNEAADAFQAGIEVEENAAAPNHRLLAEDYERLIQILTRAGRTDQIAAARDRQRYHRELRDVLTP
jgi:tetratricopeptide (TPR) repeat protein